MYVRLAARGSGQMGEGSAGASLPGEIGGGRRSKLWRWRLRVGVGDRRWSLQLSGAARQPPRYRGKTGAQDHCSFRDSVLAFSTLDSGCATFWCDRQRRAGKERLNDFAS